jgi:septum formation protein
MNFEPIHKKYPLILASASPRRKRLLRQIGLPYRSIKSLINEGEAAGEKEERVLELAKGKAKAVQSASRKHWILGADTIVVIDDTVLGKPENKEDARVMLDFLSGREHRVITGLCILDPSGHVSRLEYVTTLVFMKPLSEREISAYIATGEPFGKAGSYAIQGQGAFMVREIRGSYSNVVGLPLCALIQALLDAGALQEFPLPPDRSRSRA